MKAYKFMAVFATHFDEMTEFADLVLPEKVGLEKLQVFPNLLNWGHSGQTGYWYWGIKQPVVEPMGEARDWQDVLMEVADRMGFLKEVYERFNASTSLSDPLKEPYKLDVSRQYTPEEIADRRLKSRFGEGKGLDWFKKNGYLSYKRNVD